MDFPHIANAKLLKAIGCKDKMVILFFEDKDRYNQNLIPMDGKGRKGWDMMHGSIDRIQRSIKDWDLKYIYYPPKNYENPRYNFSR